MEEIKFKKDLSGKVFGRLTVISPSHNSKHNGTIWLCLCECGNTSLVGTSRLSKGLTLSCGCIRKEALLKANSKHGMTESPLYKRWRGMRARCGNINNPAYGGKGISITERWDNFLNFLEDMGQGFREDRELDRIDVDGDYCKENCRWVTHSENNYNKNIQPNNTSGKTGVNYRKDNNKYRAYISVNGKQISLGVYETLEDAIKAREDGELKYYGYKRDEK